MHAEHRHDVPTRLNIARAANPVGDAHRGGGHVAVGDRDIQPLPARRSGERLHRRRLARRARRRDGAPFTVTKPPPLHRHRCLGVSRLRIISGEGVHCWGRNDYGQSAR